MKLEKRINQTTGKASYFVEIKVSVYTLYYPISELLGRLGGKVEANKLWEIEIENSAEAQFDMLKKYEAELVEILK